MYIVDSEIIYYSYSDSELSARILHDGLPLSVSTSHFGVCVRSTPTHSFRIGVLFVAWFSKKGCFQQ
jgi:hypothetical protein